MTKSNKKKIKKSKLSNTTNGDDNAVAVVTKPSKKIVKKEPQPLFIKPENLKPVPSDSLGSSESESESGSGSGSESDSEPEDLMALLEPYTKEQLIVFISATAAENPDLRRRVVEMADRDVSHRKVFIHGLGPDTTREAVVTAFESLSGDIEECKLVTDKMTGKSKGYAFVLFKTRKATARALKSPQRRINNRIVSCQLASVGPNAPAGRDQAGPQGERKIYVSNVPRDVDKEKLRSFFEPFGEIEVGPIGFDVNTGKSRGFAIFVYKTMEAARRVLENPHKFFQGHQLHCQKAIDSKNRTNHNNNYSNSNIDGSSNATSVGGNSQAPVQGQNQMLAAVAAAQNHLALFGQQHYHPSGAVMNPALYGGLLAAAANPGLINPVVVGGALNQGVGVVPAGHVGAVSGGLAGSNPTVLGAYGTSQGLQPAYPNAPVRTQGALGSYPGYTSYM